MPGEDAVRALEWFVAGECLPLAFYVAALAVWLAVRSGRNGPNGAGHDG